MKTNNINVSSISQVGNYNDTDRSRVDQMIRLLIQDFFSENQIQLANFKEMKLGVYFDQEPVFYAIATKQDGTEEIIDSEQMSLSIRSTELLYLMLGLTPPASTASTYSSKSLRKIKKTPGKPQNTPPPPLGTKNRIPFSTPIRETSESEEDMSLQPPKKLSKNGPVSPVEDKNSVEEEIKELRQQFQELRKKGNSKRSSINVPEFSGKKEETSDPILNKSKGEEKESEVLKKLNEMKRKQHEEKGVGRRDSMLFDSDQKLSNKTTPNGPSKKRINFPNVPKNKLDGKKIDPNLDKKKRSYRIPENFSKETKNDLNSQAKGRSYNIPEEFTFPGYFTEEEEKRRTYNIPTDYSDEEEYHSATEEGYYSAMKLDEKVLEELLEDVFVQVAENEELKNKNELMEEILGLYLRKNLHRGDSDRKIIENYQEAIENLKKLL